MESQTYLFLLTALLSALMLWKWLSFSKPTTSNKKLPPSPPKLPVIGHLHRISALPHRDFLDMSRKYGPLMLLHLGRVPLLVVSSAEAASEMMKTQDLSFSERQLLKAPKKLFYNGSDVAFASYGDHWRQVKGSFVVKLLSHKRVQSFQPVRDEETALFLKRIDESSGAINISQMFFQFTFDGICRSSFGWKFDDSGEGNKLIYLLIKLTEVLTAVCVEDYVPWLRWIDRLNGMDERINSVWKGLDEMLDGIIDERLQNQNQVVNGEYFIDILIQTYGDNRDIIKGIIVDVFAGGTDTSASVLEWTMTELLRHPTEMEKVQREVRQVLGGKDVVTCDDIEKMHYLKAVIKEAFRCHPPLPLLIPRATGRDVKIGGYDVAAGTVVMVNLWAIGKDPNLWDEPEKFKPERFVNSKIDYKGVDFELIPFGAGRRGCPGVAYATASIELLMATILAKYDWKLPDGVRREDVDMKETSGLSVHKVVPLYAVPTKKP